MRGGAFAFTFSSQYAAKLYNNLQYKLLKLSRWMDIGYQSFNIIYSRDYCNYFPIIILAKQKMICSWTQKRIKIVTQLSEYEC